MGFRVSDLEEESTFMAPDVFQSEGFGSPNMRNVSGLHGMIQGLHRDPENKDPRKSSGLIPGLGRSCHYLPHSKDAHFDP